VTVDSPPPPPPPSPSPSPPPPSSPSPQLQAHHIRHTYLSLGLELKLVMPPTLTVGGGNVSASTPSLFLVSVRFFLLCILSNISLLHFLGSSIPSNFSSATLFFFPVSPSPSPSPCPFPLSLSPFLSPHLFSNARQFTHARSRLVERGVVESVNQFVLYTALLEVND
jgi:hypothetical protein